MELNTQVKFWVSFVVLHVWRSQFLVSAQEVTPETTLNQYLRNHEYLRGTKYMCLEGGCGVCIVAVSAVHPLTKRKVMFSVNSVSLICIPKHKFICQPWFAVSGFYIFLQQMDNRNNRRHWEQVARLPSAPKDPGRLQRNPMRILHPRLGHEHVHPIRKRDIYNARRRKLFRIKPVPMHWLPLDPNRVQVLGNWRWFWYRGRVSGHWRLRKVHQVR